MKRLRYQRQNDAACKRLNSAQSNAQLDGGLDYLKSLGDAEFDMESFEKAAGVGVEVMPS